MSFIKTLLCVAVAVIFILPFIIVTALRILLRKYSFKASVSGPFSFHSIMMRLPVKMNLQLVIRLQRLSLSFHLPKSFNEIFSVQGPPSPWFQISVNGLQINVLLRDDFKKWGNQKIELLEIITQMRQKLLAMGLLKTNLRSRIDESSNVPPQHVAEQIQVKNFDQTYKNLLLHLLVNAQDTQCNFYVYKMDNIAPGTLQDCDTNNIRDFCAFYLNNQRFQQRFLCFRLEAPKAQLRVKRMGEEDCDIGIEMKQLLLQNPNFQHKCGLLHQVELELKVPLDKKLAKDFCNYEVRIQVQDGILDLNKKFLQSFINFFVYLDTLLTVIKSIRKLVLRQHYQDSLLYEMIRQNRKGQQVQPIFANYRDTAIPQRLQVVFQEGIQLYVTDSSKIVSPYLKKINENTSQVFFGHFWKRTTFEVACTLKDSYYINFQCEEVKIDVNGKSAVRASNFVQELDLIFKREVTTSPVKLSRLEVSQKIQFQKVNVEMSPSLLNVLHEMVNFYNKSKFIASIKHTILGQISDKNFLLTNIIATSNNTEIRLSDEQILEIYEQVKHQDRLSTSFNIGFLRLRHDSHDIYESHRSQLQKQSGSFLEATLTNIKFSFLIAQGTEKSLFECSQMQIGEIQKEKSRQQQLPIVPIIKSKDFTFQKVLILPTSKFNEELCNYRVIYMKTDAKRLQVGVNLEFFLDHTNDMIDYALILNAFKNKWQTKYNLRKLLQKAYQNAVTSAIIQPYAQVQTITRLNTFYSPEAVGVWQLSPKRLICLDLSNLRPVGQPSGAYETYLGQDLHYLVTNGNFKTVAPYSDLSNTSTIAYCSSHGRWIHRYLELSSDQVIIESESLEFHYTSSSQQQDFVFNFKKTEANLPYNFHFAAGINETMKQVSHTSQWFRQAFTAKKETSGYKALQLGAQDTESQKRPARILNMMWNFEKGVISFDDDPLKHIFVAKNDICETIKERDIYRLKPKSTFSLLKKISQSQIYGKSLLIQLEKYSFSYSKPAEYLNQDQVYDKISQLDEADQFLNRRLFQELKGAKHKQQVSYMAWHGRSFLKPVFEIWGFDFSFDNLTGIQNSSANPQLFQQEIEKKIFKKFSMPVIFNKLPNKMYYDSKLEVQNIHFAAQGQQTLLFINDIGGALQRVMSFEDISNSLDPQKSLLPYFQGVDRFRHKNHGQLKISVKNAQLEIWPRRRLGRYVDRLVARFFDLEYSHKSLIEKEKKLHQGFPVVLQHLLCLRNFTVTKDPIKQFESVMINLPLVELHLFTNYNEGSTLNHYLHLKAQDLEQYLQSLEDYATKNFFVELKLNLPSFGTINTTKQKSLFLPQLMQSYVSNSPVPILNYQRSYLKIIDETLREYVNGGKRDISARVLSKIKQRKFSKTLLPENKYYQVKMKINSFIGDVLVLFTDFDEDRDTFGAQNLENQVLEPEEMEDDMKRNEYLSRYQGIVFSMENLCLQSLVEVNRGVRHRSLKSLKSYFRCNFFRVAAINSRNLYDIRHGALLEKQGGFMDNYRVFTNFFDIDKPSLLKKGDLNYETLLNGFKTLFPDYVLNNEQVQHQISEAQGAYETTDDQNNYENTGQVNEPSSIDEYFNFRDDDTIGIICRASYTQNKIIKWENHNYSNQSGGRDEGITGDPQPILEEIMVRHMFEIENMRLLYTGKIHDLFMHHLIKGFDFRQFRKNDYIDIENRQAKKRDFLQQYRQNEKNQSEGESNLSLMKQSSQIEKYLQKEAFLALVLKDHQISCQNAVSKSQLLFALNSTTTLLIHAYKLNPLFKEKASQQQKNPLSMVRMIAKDVVKYGMSVNFKSTELFIAPLCSDQYTFWANDLNLAPDQLGQSLLRKIVSMQDCFIKVQLLNELLIDFQQPKWAVELMVQKLTGEMDGPSMWHAFSVIQMILLSRGEKSSELIFIEQAKKRDLDILGHSVLSKLIDKELKKSQLKIGVDSVRPNLARRVEYSVQIIEFTLFNNSQKFTSGLIENFQGKHMIYSNRESKTDLDIDRITLFNHCDSEEYRMVLYPSNTWSHPFQRPVSQPLDSEPAPITMIKIRSRDKFVIVREAPWRVYDQLEYYIHPTSVQLTQAFYQELKVFFFENNPLSNIKNSVKDKKFSVFSARKIMKMMSSKKKPVQEISKATNDTRQASSSQSELTIEMTTQNSARSSQAVSIFENSETQQSEEFQMKQLDFPSFLRYMRINEIKVQISYFHAHHHLLNIRDFKLKIPPYISHGAFAPFKKALENYEYHCKKNFISQIPNLLMRKAAQVKEQVKNFKTDEPVEEHRSNETKMEMKVAYAKKILHGDFAI